jgi:hypothetical protein
MARCNVVAGRSDSQETFNYIDMNGCLSHCGMEVIWDAGCLLVVVSELDGNPGASVTNSIELIANQLCDSDERFSPLNPDKLFFVEHVLPDSITSEERWDLVTLTYKLQKFRSPKWAPLRDIPVPFDGVAVLRSLVKRLSLGGRPDVPDLTIKSEPGRFG